MQLLANGENRKKSFLGGMRRAWGRTLKAFGLVLLLLSLIAGCVFLWYRWQAERYDLARLETLEKGVMVVDSEGRDVGDIFGDFAYVGREEFPRHLVEALLAREDEEFYEHNGVNTSALGRAVLRNIRDWDYTQGGSTLTMQLARNVYGMRDKTTHRKLLEMALARRIEREYGKDQILEYYLNRVYFGEGCYGIGSAAKHYFGCKVKDLSVGQSALLVGILRGPSIFNPAKSESKAIQQRNETLDRMRECGYLAKEVCDREKEKAWGGKIAERSSVSYATTFLRKELEGRIQQEDIRDSGLIVLTSLDMGLQRVLETEIEGRLQELESWREFRGGKLVKEWRAGRRDPGGDGVLAWKGDGGNEAAKARMLQMAVICIHTKTGQVKAVSCGRDPIDGKDRWHELERKLGNLFAVVVNLTVSTESKNLISRYPVQCGQQVGDGKVKEMAKRLGWEGLPGGEGLYRGEFSRPLDQIARMLLAVYRGGKDAKLAGIAELRDLDGGKPGKSVARDKDGGLAIFPEPDAQVVLGEWPFQAGEIRKSVRVFEVMPRHGGYFSGVMGPEFSVFAWVGFDEEELDYGGLGPGMESEVRQFAREIPERLLDPATYRKKDEEERAAKQAEEDKYRASRTGRANRAG